MAIITALTIQQKDKNRCNLFIDGEFFSGISLETVYKFSLKKDMEIDENSLLELILESEKSQALDKALNYISKRLKTKREVKNYLLGKGYSEEIAWYVIDKLKEYNLIDDKEYVKRYVESTMKTQGKLLSDYKLMNKGVKKEDISEAYSECEFSFRDSAKALAEKRLKNKEITKEILAKTYRYLLGRGFSYDDVDYALSFFKEQD